MAAPGAVFTVARVADAGRAGNGERIFDARQASRLGIKSVSQKTGRDNSFEVAVQIGEAIAKLPARMREV
jgi:hypothetical protein